LGENFSGKKIKEFLFFRRDVSQLQKTKLTENVFEEL